MNNEIKKIKVYHGTDYSGELGILRSKKFNPSEKDDEWLGHGVYFFYNSNSIDHAKEWALNVKKFKRFSIIESEIMVENGYILDFDDINIQEVFHQYRKAKIEEYKKRSILVNEDGVKNKRKFDCMIINEMAKQGKFKLVCQRRYIEFAQRKNKEDVIYSDIPNCSVICVRDLQIIDVNYTKCIKRG